MRSKLFHSTSDNTSIEDFANQLASAALGRTITNRHITQCAQEAGFTDPDDLNDIIRRIRTSLKQFRPRA